MPTLMYTDDNLGLDLSNNKRTRKLKRVCCIGAGYVGGPTCAVMASQISDVEFSVVDLDTARIEAWNSDRLPIFEPGLEDMIHRCRFKQSPPNLKFSTDINEAIEKSDMIFITVNTPTKYSGHGEGQSCDLQFVEQAARRVAQVAVNDKIIVEKSTVPCRTAEKIRDILTANSAPGLRFDVISNPEFLAEGTAVQDLLCPDRILIGSLPEAHESASMLAQLYNRWVPREKILMMNLWTAELAKLAANCMLAQRISSINSFTAICENIGANVDELSVAIGSDSRIGSKMLRPSVGFGGSCFRKDVLSLVYMSESLHLPEVAAYWKAVVQINEWQKMRFTKDVIRCLHGTLTNKRIAVFGFAYKENTSDTRESPAIQIVQDLARERAELAIFDPKVSEAQIMKDLKIVASSHAKNGHCTTVKVCSDPYQACVGAHAVVILTRWDMFRTTSTNSVDWARIALSMQKPGFVLDGANVVEKQRLERFDLRVRCIGKGSHDNKSW